MCINDKFDVYTSRVQDELSPFVFINIPFNNNFKSLAAKISNKDHKDSFCFVQLRSFDKNYYDSRSDKFKNEHNLEELRNKCCIFVSEYYRNKLNIEPNEKAPLKIKICDNAFLIPTFYKIKIAIEHPETSYNIISTLSLIGIIFSIVPFLFSYFISDDHSKLIVTLLSFALLFLFFSKNIGRSI